MGDLIENISIINWQRMCVNKQSRVASNAKHEAVHVGLVWPFTCTMYRVYCEWMCTMHTGLRSDQTERRVDISCCEFVAIELRYQWSAWTAVCSPLAREAVRDSIIRRVNMLEHIRWCTCLFAFAHSQLSTEYLNWHLIIQTQTHSLVVDSRMQSTLIAPKITAWHKYLALCNVNNCRHNY